MWTIWHIPYTVGLKILEMVGDMRTSYGDYSLNTGELESKYMKYDFHPIYGRLEYELENASIPYWDWVYSKISNERKVLRSKPVIQNEYF